MAMNDKMTPQQKLMKAVFGKLPEEMTAEEREHWEDRIAEMQAESITDEEYEKICGESIDSSKDRMMLYVGWCKLISKWYMEHNNDRKYHVDEFKPTYSFRQVVDIAQMVYRQGLEDGKNGVTEYEHLWGTKNDNKDE